MQRSPLALTLAALVLLPVAGCDTPEPDAPSDERAVEILDSLGQPLGELTHSIVAANLQTDLDFGLLARVEVQPGEILEFYEPVEGVLVTSGAGRPEHAPVITQELAHTLAPAELWALASDGAPLPDELAEAIERLPPAQRTTNADTPRDAVPRSLASPRAPVEGGGGFCDEGYYSQGFGDCNFGDWQMCLDDWWNGAWAAHNDVYWGFANVCPAEGNVTFRITVEGGGGGIWTVHEDHVRWYERRDANCLNFWEDCDRIRMDIDDASGNRFQTRFIVYDG